MSAPVTRDLFDRRLRGLRRDRASKLGPELILLDRAFDEALDRLGDIRRRFDHALLIGAPSPAWRARLETVAQKVDVFDPGARFAAASGGLSGDEDRLDLGHSRYDLVMAIGTLDTVNDLPMALQLTRRAMKPDAPFLGALVGGDSLPVLRASMIEADRATGAVAARAHPRIEPSLLAGLLSAAGFAMQVVDVDRVALRYRSLWDLVRDLRAMAGSNILTDRSPGRGKGWARRAATAFEAQASGDRTEERIDILHFLAWSPD